jgi:hypothetical protein
VAVQDDKKTESGFKLRRSTAIASIQAARVDPATLGSRMAPVWDALLKDEWRKDASEVTRVLIQGLDVILAALGSGFSFGADWGKLILQLYEGSKARAVDEINLRNEQASAGQNQGAEGLPGDPVETPKWRIRIYILSNLPALVKVDKPTAVTLWLGALADEAFEVRAFAGVALKKLAKSDAAMVTSELAPMLVQFYKKAQQNKNYQHRIAVVKACAELETAPLFSPLQPVFVEALNDPVVNVVIAALLVAAKNKEARDQCKTEIQALQTSALPDIGGYAKAALA